MNKFNIRVYGILINQNKEVLVLDETRKGVHFTKFPGGGLEWGEGLKLCLQREFIEELGVSIIVNDLFYINEDFVESAFISTDQIIAIYYFVNLIEPQEIIQKSPCEIPRWIPLIDLTDDIVTFPIDKIVVNKLKKEIV
jgi:ADP-ribose pyrophosphatase YjhB (NUDIX family)